MAHPVQHRRLVIDALASGCEIKPDICRATMLSASQVNSVFGLLKSMGLVEVVERDVRHRRTGRKVCRYRLVGSGCARETS